MSPISAIDGSHTQVSPETRQPVITVRQPKPPRGENQRSGPAFGEILARAIRQEPIDPSIEIDRLTEMVTDPFAVVERAVATASPTAEAGRAIQIAADVESRLREARERLAERTAAERAAEIDAAHQQISENVARTGAPAQVKRRPPTEAPKAPVDTTLSQKDLWERVEVIVEKNPDPDPVEVKRAMKAYGHSQ